MTKVTFYKFKNLIIGFEISGHSGYDDFGRDIVCSAISTSSQQTVVGIRDVLKIKSNFQIDEKKALLKFKLSKSIEIEEIEKAQCFFEAFEITVRDIEKQYNKNVKLEVKDEIY